MSILKKAQEARMPKPSPSRADIWTMFDAISPSYDTVNRLMTLGLDVLWRNKVASFVPKRPDTCVLDCATGTADQLIAILGHCPQVVRATGIDMAEEMLHIGRKKLKQKPYSNKVELLKASALELPFAENTFDCVTMSFGIRNVTDVSLCLREISRVLKPGGRLLILESSLPENKYLRKGQIWYLRHLLPKIGGFVSKKKYAYEYLNQTIETFPYGKAFCQLLKQNGFCTAVSYPLLFGASTIYQAEKHSPSPLL